MTSSTTELMRVQIGEHFGGTGEGSTRHFAGLFVLPRLLRVRSDSLQFRCQDDPPPDGIPQSSSGYARLPVAADFARGLVTARKVELPPGASCFRRDAPARDFHLLRSEPVHRARLFTHSRHHSREAHIGQPSGPAPVRRHQRPTRHPQQNGAYEGWSSRSLFPVRTTLNASALRGILSI